MNDELEEQGKAEGDDEISWDDVQEESERADGGDPGGKEEDRSDGDSSASRREMKGGLREGAGTPGLGFILDIPLRLSVELGRTRMLISDLLKLGQGSVIELAKLVGEPLDIMVNGKEIARGEVVVVNEKFGVRLTDIVNPMERVEQLR